MTFIRHHLFSIIGLTAAIQTVIILYNHFTGFFTIQTPSEFFVRVLYGIFFASPVAIAIVAIDERIVRLLDTTMPWERRFLYRIGMETALAAIAGGVLGAAITVIVHQLSPYRDGLWPIVVKNVLITAVINLIIAAIIEAVVATNRSREAREKAERLEQEISRIRFETLKTQLNPHFMFNSLNVLSSLLRKDPKRAEHFIAEFANVYRYTLEVIEQPVVELRRELEFARSYLFLMQIRFADAVTAEISVDSIHLPLLVPSLSIQTVLENAFKHNKASEESPLRIGITSQHSVVRVTNTLQLKQQREASNGVGLNNLRKRYALLGNAEPAFTVNGNEFIAILPLITPQ